MSCLVACAVCCYLRHGIIEAYLLLAQCPRWVRRDFVSMPARANFTCQNGRWSAAAAITSRTLHAAGAKGGSVDEMMAGWLAGWLALCLSVSSVCLEEASIRFVDSFSYYTLLSLLCCLLTSRSFLPPPLPLLTPHHSRPHASTTVLACACAVGPTTTLRRLTTPASQP